VSEGSTHTVRQGECVASIAAQYGFHPGTIWKAPENAALRELRKEPHILRPGDSLYIPQKSVKYVSIMTDNKHRFVRSGVPEILSIQFFLNEQPRSHSQFDVMIDGVSSSSATDGNGVARITIPPEAKRATVTLTDTNEQFELKLGFMDPVTEIAGIKGRLLSLGFYHGVVDDTDSADLAAAIKEFQLAAGLTVNGEVDDNTRRKLLEAYGE